MLYFRISRIDVPFRQNCQQGDESDETCNVKSQRGYPWLIFFGQAMGHWEENIVEFKLYQFNLSHITLVSFLNNEIDHLF